MVRGKKTKAAVLILGAVIIAVSCVQWLAGIDVRDLGTTLGSPLSTRMTYHFFHASVLHAVLNVWCLLSLAFFYHVTATELVLSYCIASLYPVGWMHDVLGATAVPTVGLSAVCFALMGMVTYRVVRKRYYTACIVTLIGIGFLMPNVNAVIHLYAYLAALLVGLFTEPLLKR